MQRNGGGCNKWETSAKSDFCRRKRRMRGGWKEEGNKEGLTLLDCNALSGRSGRAYCEGLSRTNRFRHGSPCFDEYLVNTCGCNEEHLPKNRDRSASQKMQSPTCQYLKHYTREQEHPNRRCHAPRQPQRPFCTILA